MSKTERYKQIELNLEVVTSKDIDGVEMGVLNDGTPFLTERGLARLSGVHKNAVANQAQNYAKYKGGQLAPSKLAEIIEGYGFQGGQLYFKVTHEGQGVNAYPDIVCMGFLTYYAYEAGRYCTQEAKASFFLLANKSLRDYIYSATGYDPARQMMQSWQCFHDRLLLNPMPAGYFSVFSETAHLVLQSIRVGLLVDDHTVPDISVGQAWSRYWKGRNLDGTYGSRARFPHVYPDYFPQAQANGDIKPYVYPNKALGEFREWLEIEYLPQKFPNYLRRKAQQGAIPATRVQELLRAVEPTENKALPPTA